MRQVGGGEEGIQYLFNLRDGPLQKLWGRWGKNQNKIHARENVRKKIHAQDGPHFDMKP